MINENIYLLNIFFPSTNAYFYTQLFLHCYSHTHLCCVIGGIECRTAAPGVESGEGGAFQRENGPPLRAAGDQCVEGPGHAPRENQRRWPTYIHTYIHTNRYTHLTYLIYFAYYMSQSVPIVLYIPTYTIHTCIHTYIHAYVHII